MPLIPAIAGLIIGQVISSGMSVLLLQLIRSINTFFNNELLFSFQLFNG